MKVKLLSRVRLLATYGLQPTRLLHPWDFPGTSTGVGCHCLLRESGLAPLNLLLCLPPDGLFPELCSCVVSSFSSFRCRLSSSLPGLPSPWKLGCTPTHAVSHYPVLSSSENLAASASTFTSLSAWATCKSFPLECKRSEGRPSKMN